jgi:DUF2934 family protein
MATAARRRADETTSATEPLASPHEEVAYRAYDLFMARGGVHGYDVEDWLAAEDELRRARMSESEPENV